MYAAHGSCHCKITSPGSVHSTGCFMMFAKPTFVQLTPQSVTVAPLFLVPCIACPGPQCSNLHDNKEQRAYGSAGCEVSELVDKVVKMYGPIPVSVEPTVD